ncbi:MAG: aromatic ring-hydroxylating dioxygenase subunit alpha [Dehalococcoidia bacterium]
MTATDLKASMARGYTLPAPWYSDPALFSRELSVIFRRSWLYAGHVGQAANPGDYLTFEAGDVPVVIVRQRDGALKAFVNVCRHRGTMVVQGSGSGQSLQCPYHAWTYDLDGELRAVPRSEAEPGFDCAEFSLLPVDVETWGPFVFVNVDAEASPLGSVLGDLPDQLRAGGIDVDSLRFKLHDEWELKANWKITVENYLECYHCPVAHPEFSKVIDVRPEQYRLSSAGWVWSQVGPVRESVRAGAADADWARGEIADSQFHLLWPNCTLNTYPGAPNLIFSVYRPIDAERTLMVSDAFFPEGVDEGAIRAMFKFSAQVTREDQGLVEAVHHGLRSGIVNQGRLLLNSEHLIHRFQRLIHEALTTESPAQ